jgi:hypothetical protein
MGLLDSWRSRFLILSLRDKLSEQKETHWNSESHGTTPPVNGRLDTLEATAVLHPSVTADTFVGSVH